MVARKRTSNKDVETEEKKAKTKTKQADLFDPKNLEMLMSFFAKAKMPNKNEDIKTKIESLPSKEAKKAKKKEKTEKKKRKKKKKKAKKDKKKKEKKDSKEEKLKEKQISKLKVEIDPKWRAESAKGGQVAESENIFEQIPKANPENKSDKDKPKAKISKQRIQIQ